MCIAKIIYLSTCNIDLINKEATIITCVTVISSIHIGTFVKYKFIAYAYYICLYLVEI